MRVPVVLVAAAALLAACGDPSSPDAAGPAPATAAPAIAAPTDGPLRSVVVGSCGDCAYGVVQYTRTLGGRFEQASFAADPSASWVLVVTDDGNATTGAEVLVNGTQRVAKAALEGAATTEVRVPVTLSASNTVAVRVFGAIGATVRVSVVRAAAATLTISPPTSERLPNGTQQFAVTAGPPGPYTWSVRGTDGGNSTFGTITTAGLYTAPSAVPSPSSFQVCARVTATPAVRGCATVTINPVPTPGLDVVVVNDMNLLDDVAMQDVNNQRFARNLANYTAAGPRASGTGIIYDRGRNSPCFADAECGDGRQTILDTVFQNRGFTITKRDAVTSYASIPAGVKLIILFNPKVAFTRDDINGFKQFASEGGRIVWLGEHVAFYGSDGIDIENQFMQDMGAQLTNLGDFIDCGYNVIPGTSLRSQQVTTGLTQITFACGSRIILGPNDFPFLYDLGNSIVLGALAKIDTRPLPPVATVTKSARVAARAPAAATAAKPAVDGTGKPLPAGGRVR